MGGMGFLRRAPFLYGQNLKTRPETSTPGRERLKCRSGPTVVAKSTDLDSGHVRTASALARNDPTLLAKSDPAPQAQRGAASTHEKNDHAPVGTSLPRKLLIAHFTVQRWSATDQGSTDAARAGLLPR